MSEPSFEQLRTLVAVAADALARRLLVAQIDWQAVGYEHRQLSDALAALKRADVEQRQFESSEFSE